MIFFRHSMCTIVQTLKHLELLDLNLSLWLTECMVCTRVCVVLWAHTLLTFSNDDSALVTGIKLEHIPAPLQLLITILVQIGASVLYSMLVDMVGGVQTCTVVQSHHRTTYLCQRRVQGAVIPHSEHKAAIIPTCLCQIRIRGCIEHTKLCVLLK